MKKLFGYGRTKKEEKKEQKNGIFLCIWEQNIWNLNKKKKEKDGESDNRHQKEANKRQVERKN